MPRHKKPFIDKKKSVTFQLVHRSQKDPLAADEDAPQRVLIPRDERLRISDKSSEPETPAHHESRLSTQKSHGIQYEDDYDYMQHLSESRKKTYAILVPKESRNVSLEMQEDGFTKVQKVGGSTLHLPSVVFGSKTEEKVGMLHRAIPPVGPQPSWDPDIVAGLEEDFDYENPNNELEDDFIAMACEGESEEEVDSDMGGSFYSDDDYDECKSQFTAYSMTSSVIRRNEQLTLLDDRFEKFFESYEDSNIGDLSQVEIEGGLPVHNIDETRGMKMLLGIKEESEDRLDIPETFPKIKQVAEESGIVCDDEVMVSIVKEDRDSKWDCESILSTYSTLYNHPKLIEDPPMKVKISEKTGIPVNTAPRLTKKELRSLDVDSDQNISPKSKNNVRMKTETKEEKNLRKKAFKEAKKDRRQEKKATKIAFKEEKCRQTKEILNIRQNLSGIKIS